MLLKLQSNVDDFVLLPTRVFTYVYIYRLCMRMKRWCCTMRCIFPCRFSTQGIILFLFSLFCIITELITVSTALCSAAFYQTFPMYEEFLVTGLPGFYFLWTSSVLGRNSYFLFCIKSPRQLMAYFVFLFNVTIEMSVPSFNSAAYTIGLILH